MTDETQPVAQPKNIHEAILAVMNEVGYVRKVKAANLNYTYAGEAALISAIRPWMVEFGIYPSVLSYEEVTREVYETSNGKKMNSTTCKAVIRFTHATSETFVDVEALGEGSDAGDKSANKAATGAYKYALRQTFCIETGDDPDKDPSDMFARAEAKSKAAEGKAPQNGSQKANTNGTPKAEAKTEPAKPNGHTQKELVGYAKTFHNVDAKDVGPALVKAGITAFDPAKWAEMTKAIEAFALERDMASK